jgi:drug/metabolite transporter (DMT)-like permease
VAAKQAMNQLVGLAKAQAILLNPFVLGGFLLYGIGALVWLEVLSHWDVSKAYPLVGLGFGLSLVIGIALGEHVTTLRTIGVVLICIGVFLVGRS